MRGRLKVAVWPKADFIDCVVNAINRHALEQILTFRSTSAVEVYETLREALADDPCAVR